MLLDKHPAPMPRACKLERILIQWNLSPPPMFLCAHLSVPFPCSIKCPFLITAVYECTQPSSQSLVYIHTLAKHSLHPPAVCMHPIPCSICVYTHSSQCLPSHLPLELTVDHISEWCPLEVPDWIRQWGPAKAHQTQSQSCH